MAQDLAIKVTEREIELLLEVLDMFLDTAPSKASETYLFAIGLKKVLEGRK
jgi:hypothetical protein